MTVERGRFRTVRMGRRFLKKYLALEQAPTNGPTEPHVLLRQSAPLMPNVSELLAV
jgi:hypothetical protein